MWDLSDLALAAWPCRRAACAIVFCPALRTCTVHGGGPRRTAWRHAPRSAVDGWLRRRDARECGPSRHASQAMRETVAPRATNVVDPAVEDAVGLRDARNRGPWRHMAAQNAAHASGRTYARAARQVPPDCAPKTPYETSRISTRSPTVVRVASIVPTGSSRTPSHPRSAARVPSRRAGRGARTGQSVLRPRPAGTRRRRRSGSA